MLNTKISLMFLARFFKCLYVRTSFPALVCVCVFIYKKNGFSIEQPHLKFNKNENKILLMVVQKTLGNKKKKKFSLIST